jgi:hypothetical protein
MALALSLGLATIFGATHALANSVVVRSTGPSAKTYPPGKSLAANSALALKAGDMITILDNRGTRVLKGPGTISTGAAATTTGSAFNQLLRNTGVRQARTGATRGTGTIAATRNVGPLRSPNLWFVDYAKSGTMCVTNPAAVSIWRPSGAAMQSVTLTRVSDGKSAVVAFRPGQTVQAWPSGAVPVVDGAEYRVSTAGAANQSIKMNMISAASAEPGQIAATLIEKGCTAQLDLMVEAGGTSG